VKQTLTAKLQLTTTPEQFAALRTTQLTYRDGSNSISRYAYAHGKSKSTIGLHKGCYLELRAQYHLPSQMACIGIREVAATYKGHWTKAKKNATARQAGQTKKRCILREGKKTMAVRNLIFYGNPILRQKAKKIHRFDTSLPKLVQDMFETMHANNGVGLAAPQIAQSIRLFVVECTDHETDKHYKVAMANPEIVKASGEQVGVDGCLSIPGYYGVNVRRANHVVVKGQDMHGKPLRISAEGYFAWALQHEIDHLNGILYLDRLDRPEDLREAGPDTYVEDTTAAR